jgi:hypothetical protein
MIEKYKAKLKEDSNSQDSKILADALQAIASALNDIGPSSTSLNKKLIKIYDAANYFYKKSK